MKTRSPLTAILLAAAIAAPASAHVVDIVLQPSSLLSKGNIAIQMGDTESARHYFDEALKSQLNDRQRSLAHNGMCVVDMMEERWSEALRQCDAAIRLRPTNWRFYNNRGNIFLEQGDLARAREEYEYGLTLAPQAGVIRRNMEIVDRREGARGGEDGLHATPAQRYL